MLLSDGVDDDADAQGEQFGRERVEQALRDGHARSAAEVADHMMPLVQAVAGAAPQDDDITIVLLERQPAGRADVTVL